MLSCVAMILGVSLTEIPSLALNVEAEARALSAHTEVTPAFLTELQQFSGDSERLAVALRQAGVEQDLPCIFHGIGGDALERVNELQAADTAVERAEAFTNLHALLDDAILIAPMAASAAADRVAAAQASTREASAH